MLEELGLAPPMFEMLMEVIPLPQFGTCLDQCWTTNWGAAATVGSMTEAWSTRITDICLSVSVLPCWVIWLQPNTLLQLPKCQPAEWLNCFHKSSSFYFTYPVSSGTFQPYIWTPRSHFSDWQPSYYYIRPSNISEWAEQTRMQLTTDKRLTATWHNPRA